MSLRARATTALTWSWLQAGAGAILQFATTAIMVRLLVPADFGVVALATVFVRFLAYFSQMGFGVAIVQRAEVRSDELSGLTTLSVAIGLAFTALAMALSLFASGEVGPVLRVLAVTFAITGFSVVPYGVLRRELKNRELAVIEFLAQLLGTGVVAVGMAAMGAGVWSIVGGTLTQQTVIAAGSWFAVRRDTPLGFARPTAASRGYLDFGLRHSSNTFLEFIFYNVEVLVIGQWFGTTTTGFYNRGYSLSHLGVEQVFSSVVRVLFPVLARLRGEPAKERAAFLAAFLLGGMFATGLCAAMYVSAPEIVAVMFGPKWTATIPIIRVFAIAVPFRYLVNMQSAWLDARGALRVRNLAILGCLALKLAALAIAIVRDAGLVELLVLAIVPDLVWQLIYLVVVPAATSITHRALQLAYLAFAANAAIVAVAETAVTAQLRALDWPALPILAVQVALGVTLVALACLVVDAVVDLRRTERRERATGSP
jgi:lipopolysaccharide exporter